MNSNINKAKWFVGLGSCLGAWLSLSGVALADELPPSAYRAPPTQDRPSENTPAGKIDGERKAKNLVYFELLGNGGLYSLNYERMIGNDLSARLGFSYFSVSASSSNGSQTSTAKADIVTAPVMLNYMTGGKNSKFELGAGALVVYASASGTGGGATSSVDGMGVAGTGTVGYRYSPADGGFVFRVGFTPIVGKGGFLPWGGMSFGGTF